MNVLIYGAGSIGNHLAHGCRNKGWNVMVCDTDPAALKRMKEDIYPSRYGQWDESINLVRVQDLSDEQIDVIIIGTPPDTHITVALSALEAFRPRVVLIEKPLCPPDLKGCCDLNQKAAETGTKLLIGYNHLLCRNTVEAERIMADGALGVPLSIHVRWQEYWGGIFAAHPWLAGPHDSYLGFSSRGGGACGEHSHAISIWQHFSHILGMGRIDEVFCMMDMVSDGKVEYDRLAQLSVKTEGGLMGTIVQDVITDPPVKTLRVQAEQGFLEWYAGFDSGHDAVIHAKKNEAPDKDLFPRTRPDDFQGEIEEVARLVETGSSDSHLSIEHGMDTMLVVAAAHRSCQLKQAVKIDYKVGYKDAALSVTS